MAVIKFYICAIAALSVFVVCSILWKINNEAKQLKNQMINRKFSKPKGIYPLDTLGLNDYQQLINLKNFSFTIINNCGNSTLLLLVLVHSHSKNFEKRQIIRKTWGQNNKNLKTFFMTGFIEDPIIVEKLSEENTKYGDLVQGSFVEHYKNLTYKHIMVFKYAIYHCPQAEYILKTDDDVFVNTPLMTYFLQTGFLMSKSSKKIVCSLMVENPAIRKESKWKVSFEEYPEKFYPPHCSGFTILYSSYVLFELYKETQNTKYFWIDDAHVTGIIAQKLNLTHLDIEELMLKKDESSNPSSISKIFLFGFINVNIEEIKQLWNYILKKNLYNSILHEINTSPGSNE